jgi:hypothetical protein
MTAKRVAVLAIVVGDNDEPVYLKDLKTFASSDDGTSNMEEYLYHFVLHSSLDMVSEKQWQTQSSYLGVVETFREYSVSAWVGVSGVKLLLLHRGLTELAVKSLLKGVHLLWLRIAANPLHDREEAISGPAFDTRLAAISVRYLAGS